MEESATPDESTEEKSQTEREDGESEEDEFSVLEREYKAVLLDLEKSEAPATVRQEYERMFAAVRRAHERELALQEQNGSLRARIDADAAKVATAIRLSEHDKSTIDQLKQELREMMARVDAAHEREQAAQDAIENLRHQLAQRDLRRASDEGLGADQARKECEALRGEVGRLEAQLQAVSAARDQLLERQRAVDHHLADLAQELETQSNELAKETRLKDKMEAELQELSEMLAGKTAALSALQFDLQESQHGVARLEAALKEQRAASEALGRDSEALQGQLQRLQADLQAQTAALATATRESADRAAELKAKEARMVQLEGVVRRAKQSYERQRKRVRELESKRLAALQRLTKQKEAADAQQRELQMAQRELLDRQAEAAHMARTIQLLTNNLTRAQSGAQQHTEMMQLQELAKRTLETELDRCTAEGAKLRKQLAATETERDKYVTQSLELKKEVDKAAGELKLKQSLAFDGLKKIAETETKLRQQQTLYDAARADRNSLSQSLLESQAETTELKRKLKIMSHQVEQMKEDISHKEGQLIKGELALQRAEKEREGLRGELNRLQQDVRACQQQIQEMQLEERKLQRAVQQGDEERQRQHKEIRQIMNERDILGTQLVRRNDELALVYKKDRILETTLSRGQAQYDQRLDDIRLLRLEIRRLRREKGLLVDSVTNSTDLRQEVFHLQRDLAREQTKCRALEEELQTPLNVHRWRKLEGSDPDRYELLQKVRLLQRRLLAQSDAAVEREARLRELERMQAERPAAEPQEGPSTAELLHRAQAQMRDKQRKIKGLLAELSMCEAQASEYKADLDRTTQELGDLKKKYCVLKRKEQNNRDRRRSQDDASPTATEAAGDGERQFVGGGFNLSATPAKPP
ncbi:cilia- and flagella-associated protein 58-like [Bacillus rossius redtenbacheri]|uniref:cilia- and flagella-associated protein 58-like n=1 Tax=Bacillus rossius redtenbacheri TaxID=93214 RepID=UPI002FDECF92